MSRRLLHLATLTLLLVPYAHAREHKQPLGYLGINFREIPDDQLSAFKIRDGRGEEIILVDHDGPACAAGIKEHDVLLQLNGQPIESEDQLRRALREMPAGKRVSFLISRDGQQQTLIIELANRDTVGQQAWDRHLKVPEPAAHTTALFPEGVANIEDLPRRGGSPMLNSAYTGATLELMSPQLADFFGTQTGLLVRSVDPDSPAATAGLRAGDVVTHVNATPLLSSNDWLRAVQTSKGRPLAVVVRRDKKDQTLTLVPDPKRRAILILPSAPNDDPEPQLAIGPFLVTGLPR